jgi:hypothetical protein
MTRYNSQETVAATLSLLPGDVKDFFVPRLMHHLLQPAHGELSTGCPGMHPQWFFFPHLGKGTPGGGEAHCCRLKGETPNTKLNLYGVGLIGEPEKYHAILKLIFTPQIIIAFMITIFS